MADIPLLRSVLRQTYRLQKMLGDEFAGNVLRNRIRYLHHPCMKTASAERIQNACAEIKELDESLRKANAGSLPAFNHVLELAYGRKGSFRDHLLRPHLKDLEPSLEALKPLHPLLESQISHSSAQVIRKGPVFPVRDESIQGPLHWRRRNNIVNKWWTNRVVSKVRPPLSSSGMASLERLAAGRFTFRAPRPNFRQPFESVTPNEQKILQLRTITKRFVQRRAGLILSEVPVLNKDGVVGLSPLANAARRHKRVTNAKKAIKVKQA